MATEPVSEAERSNAEGRRAPAAAVLRGKLRLQDLEVGGRRVLVRSDLNVPVEDGRVTDDTRIVATLPTLRHLLRAGAAVVLCSHRGRPAEMPEERFSMRPVAEALRQRLNAPVTLAPDCVGEEVERLARELRPGSVLLLENLRFHAGEKKNDPAFAAALARTAQLYVDDAFGAAHRAHASIVGVPALLPAAAGDLMQREVGMLSRVLVQPQPPFLLLLGGAKVSDKVGVIGNLLPLVDRIVVGGAMANAFLAAEGRDMGGSLAPGDAVEQARQILASARERGVEVMLPTDLVVAAAIDRPETAHVVTGEVAGDEMALDIGPETSARYAEAISAARTVVWNGPMGVFEKPAFAAGTEAVARAVAALPSSAFTVVGGGDTVAAATHAGIAERVSHVSTGGGASLDLLAGQILPGVAALTDREGSA